MYTVQVCIDATGNYFPLMIVYKAVNLYHSWSIGGPDNCHYTTSPSGWMEKPQFKEWFETIFIKHAKNITGPKLLVLDGHNSHINIDIINPAKNKDIDILCLPAHTSHLLQPLDVGVFAHVKREWKKFVAEYAKSSGKEIISKEKFPPLIRKLKEISFKRSHAVAGFEGTGVCPVNRKVIKNSDLFITSTFELEDDEISMFNEPSNQNVETVPQVSSHSSSDVSNSHTSEVSTQPSGHINTNQNEHQES